MAYNLIKIAKELNLSTSKIIEYLTSKGIEVGKKPIAKISDDIRKLLLQKFSNVMVDKEKPKALKKDTKRKKEIIKEKEKEVVLSIYKELGKKNIINYINSEFYESKMLYKLFEYLQTDEVEKKIENTLLQLYSKVAREKRLHPLEELVMKWNKNNNYILKRRKIFDFNAFNNMKEKRRENINKIKINSLTLDELREELQFDENEFSKILQAYGIENKPKVPIGKENCEKLNKMIVKRQKELEKEMIISEKEKKIQDQQENEKRKKKKLKEKNIISENQIHKKERDIDSIKRNSISTKSSVYPIYTPMKG